jgi:hypothetical protein
VDVLSLGTAPIARSGARMQRTERRRVPSAGPRHIRRYVRMSRRRLERGHASLDTRAARLSPKRPAGRSRQRSGTCRARVHRSGIRRARGWRSSRCLRPARRRSSRIAVAARATSVSSASLPRMRASRCLAAPVGVIGTGRAGRRVRVSAVTTPRRRVGRSSFSAAQR